MNATGPIVPTRCTGAATPGRPGDIHFSEPRPLVVGRRARPVAADRDEVRVGAARGFLPPAPRPRGRLEAAFGGLGSVWEAATGVDPAAPARPPTTHVSLARATRARASEGESPSPLEMKTSSACRTVGGPRRGSGRPRRAFERPRRGRFFRAEQARKFGEDAGASSARLGLACPQPRLVPPQPGLACTRPRLARIRSGFGRTRPGLRSLGQDLGSLNEDSHVLGHDLRGRALSAHELGRHGECVAVQLAVGACPDDPLVQGGPSR
jgi:hypothetical protein